MNDKYNNKNPWKKNTMEMEGNFKLAIYSKQYIDEPTEENLNIFKEELEKSSSLSMASVINYLNQIATVKKEYAKSCKTLIKLIEPKFEKKQSTIGVYDEMLGEFIYEGEANIKSKN